MKSILFATVFAATAAFAMGPRPADAAGCLKGAAVGGVAGHVAGHGVLGAAAGCAVGRHQANKSARAQTVQSNTGSAVQSSNSGAGQGNAATSDGGATTR